MDTKRFLDTVITTESGHFCLLYGPIATEGGARGIYVERWFNWPEDEDKIIEIAEKLCQETNVYFGTQLYAEQKSTKDYCLPSRTISADLDEADLDNLPVEPSILVETSENRHQAFWIIHDRETVTLEDLELFSKRMTYSIEDADKSGWPLARKPRLANTFNYKYNPPEFVRVKEASLRVYTLNELDSLLVKVDEIPVLVRHSEQEMEWIDSAESIAFDTGPLAMFEQYKQKMPSSIRAKYKTGTIEPRGGKPSRSEQLWSLEVGLFRAGAPKDEVFWMAKHSTWNKFNGRSKELAKDVLRAEKKNRRVEAGSIKQAVAVARKQTDKTRYEKLEDISTLVKFHMTKSLEMPGEFITTKDGLCWYLGPKGKPIHLTKNSENLESLLENVFGLNAIDEAQRYVVNNLISWTREHGKVTESSVLSWYDELNNEVLIHTGGRDVYLIGPKTIDKISNGQHGVLFTWNGWEDFDVDYEHALEDWAGFLFEGFFENLVDLNKTQATSLFKVWILFILMRNIAINRPILALFGQPGSGKSTLFRMIYALFYGPYKSLDSATNSDNFDMATTTEPFVVLDNVDTWERWLPDRLALAASTSDVLKRKLYTDMDSVTMKRQAVLGISAHNPKFGREDVIDRLLMVNFARFEKFMSEGLILERVYAFRNTLWGGIAKDIQKVLSVPRIIGMGDIPQFRITDFARIGVWIARGLGCEQSFREALATNIQAAVAYSLSEEDILLEAIKQWIQVRKNKVDDEYYSPGLLWSILEMNAPDVNGFRRNYKNTVQLGKKMWIMYNMLQSVFDISFEYDQSRGHRSWRINLKETEEE